MQKFTTLDDCIALARFAHRNQHDKAGLPYIEHPLRVMSSVQAQGALPYVQMAAVLHDVTEDTAYTAEILRTLGTPEAAVEIISLLDRDVSAKKFHALNIARDTAVTKRYGRTFKYYAALGPEAQDDFYYDEIRKNNGAKVVKMSDIDDNTQMWGLSYLPVETQERLLEKYEYARNRLSLTS